MELIILFTVIFIFGFLMKIFSHDFFDFLGEAIIYISVIALMIISIGFVGSHKSINYINKKYNTNYTTNQYFWNSSFIKSELKINDKILDNNSKIKVEFSSKE